MLLTLSYLPLGVISHKKVNRLNKGFSRTKDTSGFSPKGVTFCTFAMVSYVLRFACPNDLVLSSIFYIHIVTVDTYASGGRPPHSMRELWSSYPLDYVFIARIKWLAANKHLFTIMSPSKYFKIAHISRMYLNFSSVFSACDNYVRLLTAKPVCLAPRNQAGQSFTSIFCRSCIPINGRCGAECCGRGHVIGNYVLMACLSHRYIRPFYGGSAS